MRGLWFIARSDVSYTVRQKEAIAWIFVMPIVFFYFIGTVTGGFGGGGETGRRDRLVIEAAPDAGFLVDAIARGLERQDLDVTRVSSSGELPDALRRLVVPSPSGDESFTEAVLAGRRQIVRLRNRSEGPAADFDRFRVARAVYGVVADLAVVAEQGSEPTAAALDAVTAMPRALTLTVTPAGRRVVPPTGFEQAIPGTMVMFTMLVLLTSGAIMLVVERERGLLRRLASTPVPRAAVAGGKWAGKMALGLVQIGFALVVGTVLFRMPWGGAFPMVALVLLAWASFNASLAILLANATRSQAQAAGVGVLTTMALAALGGCWWPIEVTPRWMQTLALFLPTGWTMDAMHRLVSFGEPWTAAAPHVLALSVATTVIGWAAVRTFRYD